MEAIQIKQTDKRSFYYAERDNRAKKAEEHRSKHGGESILEWNGNFAYGAPDAEFGKLIVEVPKKHTAVGRRPASQSPPQKTGKDRNISTVIPEGIPAGPALLWGRPAGCFGNRLGTVARTCYSLMALLII